MKRAISKCLTLGLLVSLPLVLFFAARETASWRPQKVAGLPYDGALAISPDERFIANASSDEQGLITVRDLQNGIEVKHRALLHRVTALAFSPDGRYLGVGWRDITGSGNTKRVGISLWEFEGECRAFHVPQGNILFDTPTQIRFSPDSRTVWLASSDNLRAWAVASGKLKWQWRNGDLGRDSSLPFFSAVSKDCRLYFRSDSEGYTVWDTSSKKRLLHTKLPFLADADLKFSSDASLATYYADTPKGIFNPVVKTDTGQILWQLQGESELTLIGDKAVNLKQNTFEVRNGHTGRLLHSLPTSPKISPLPFESRLWLYSINDKNELFRQRLQ